MRIGIGCAGVGAGVSREFVITSATTAESLGFGSFWASEHPALFEEYNPKHEVEHFSFSDPTLAFHDPLIMLAVAAGVTSTLKLGTAVALISQRVPIILAKQVASLDRLSEGRVWLGIGSGWAREQYAAIGIPFERRGARLVEHLQAMRTLWRDEASTYHGEFVNFDRAYSFPKPHKGDVTVLMGGVTDVMLKRAAQYADGWVPVRLGPDQVREGMEKIKSYADEIGRDISGFKVVAHQFVQALSVDDCRRYRDYGVDEVVLSSQNRLPTEKAALEDAIAALARDYIEALA